jgi:hypothetical protein
MNPNAVDPLAGLRGYRLPDAVSGWPPAPGWWLLAGLLLLLLGVAVYFGMRRRRRRAGARLALAELARLRTDLAADGDQSAYLRAVSQLLRRFALTRFPRAQVAGLTGKDWLRFLDAQGGDGRFCEGPGQVLADALYRPSVELSAAELHDLLAEWIIYNRERRA